MVDWFYVFSAPRDIPYRPFCSRTHRVTAWSHMRHARSTVYKRFAAPPKRGRAASTPHTPALTCRDCHVPNLTHFGWALALSLVPCLSFSPSHEKAGSPLLDLESIALGALLRSYQRSSSAARPQHVQAAAHLFLHMLRHLSLMFTEVRPGGKGYLITVWVRPELGSGSGLGLGLGLGLGGSGRQGGTRRGSSPR